MRRAAILLTLAIGGWLLTACGASSNRAPNAHGAAHARGAGALGSLSERPISRRSALAFARAVNLRASDVPGFSISHEGTGKTPRERRAELELLRCTGSRGAGHGLASASSNDFQFKRALLNLSVSSEVGVAPSAAVAAGELAAIHGARVRSCVSRYLDEILAGQRLRGVTPGRVSIEAGTPPAPGTTGSFGWRIIAPLAVRGVKVSFYMDILGFVDGPARVTLFSSGALLPFPADIQQQLFLLLLRRVQAHRL